MTSVGAGGATPAVAGDGLDDAALGASVGAGDVADEGLSDGSTDAEPLAPDVAGAADDAAAALADGFGEVVEPQPPRTAATMIKVTDVRRIVVPPQERLLGTGHRRGLVT